MHKSVFVSSTFRDFQTERDLIQNQVEIKVNEGLRDLHVSFVDLRWGIDTTNETGLDKVVAICIEEVLASYPYYIIMLGDNYGSCVEDAVVRLLYAMNGLCYDGHQKSVTEIEIEATGLFEGRNQFVLVLDRRTGESSTEDAAAALKEKVLSAALPENVFRYDARVTPEGTYILAQESAFVEFIARRLVSFLESELTQDENGHLSVAREEAARFLGRENAMLALEQALESDDESYVFQIYGRHGSGRTAAMAQLYFRFREKPGVCAAFVTGCADGQILSFHNVMSEIAEQLNLPVETPHGLMKALDEDTAYYFFVDDYPSFGDSRFLDQLVRQNLVPENVTFVAIVEDPEEADACLEPLSKAEALKIFDQTMRLYNKQVPVAFRTYFGDHISQGMVESPALLKCYAASLCYLDVSEYRRLGQSRDFMEELTRLFVEKTECFPKTEEEYIYGQVWGNQPELISFFPGEDDGHAFGQRFGEGPELWILGLLALSRDGLDEQTLLGVLRTAEIPCQPVDFHNLKVKLREGLRRKMNGDYVIAYGFLRRSVLHLLGPEEQLWLRYLLADYLGQNPAVLTLPGAFREVAYQYFQAGDPELMTGLLELQYYMPDHAQMNGWLFSGMCEDYGADEPSQWYQWMANRGNPKVTQWLCKYAMPFLTAQYVQNGLPLFRKMWDTVSRAGIKSEVADDIFALFVKSMVMNLNLREAETVVLEKFRDGSLAGLHASLVLELFRIRCWQYDTKNTAMYLDLLLENTDLSAPGSLSLMLEVLYCLVLLDGNMAALRPQMEKMFPLLAQELLRCEHPQHGRAIGAALRYLCDVMELAPGMPAEELERLCQEEAGFENMLCYRILWDSCQAFEMRDRDALRDLVGLIGDYVLDDIPVSTMELWYLAKFFRRICYRYPRTLKESFVAQISMKLFDRIADLAEPVACSQQLVELCYLCYLGNLFACGTEWEAEAREMQERLFRGANGRYHVLLEELAFFEEDAVGLKTRLGEKADFEMQRLRRTIRSRMK